MEILSTRKIKIKTWMKGKTGSFGTYIKSGKNNGIKIINFYKELSGIQGIDSFNYLLTRKSYLKNVYKEAFLLKKSEKSKLTPRRPQIVLVEIKNNGYLLGIKMEHIHGNKICPCSNFIENGKISKRGKTKIDQFIKKELRNFGVKISDFHKGNVILTKRNKIKRIDFTPKYNHCSSTNGYNTIEFKKGYKKFIKTLSEMI